MLGTSKKALLGILLSVSAGFASAAAINYQVAPYIVGAGNIGDNARYGTGLGVGYDGVAGLIITTTEGTFLCTGSLLADGRSVLTAAHCVTDAVGDSTFISANAVFFPSPTGAAETIASSQVFINEAWTGDLFNGNDVAILRLDTEASAGVQRYELFEGSNDVGSNYDVVGFGQRGSNGAGVSLGSGLRRHGFNSFDATLADIGFGGDNVLLSDFDSGLLANDGFNFFFGMPANLGLGLNEVSTAPGDSGGPSFINGQIAGITSFGLTFTFDDGTSSDISPGVLNSSFGEFNGMTRVSSYTYWISTHMLPEPPSIAMLGGALLLLGLFARRRESKAR